MKLSRILGALFLSFAALFSNAAHAESQDDCAIWLCLPAGFPGGCGGAYSAFKDRIKHFRPPLPDFASCSVQSPDSIKMTYTLTSSAFVPEHQECSEWRSWGDSDHCVAYKTVPAHYVDGTACQKDNDGGPVNPPYCTQTLRTLKVFSNGTQQGSTFRW